MRTSTIPWQLDPDDRTHLLQDQRRSPEVAYDLDVPRLVDLGPDGRAV